MKLDRFLKQETVQAKTSSSKVDAYSVKGIEKN